MKKLICYLCILSVLFICGCGQVQEDVKENEQKNAEDIQKPEEGNKEVVEATPVPEGWKIRRREKF